MHEPHDCIRAETTEVCMILSEFLRRYGSVEIWFDWTVEDQCSRGSASLGLSKGPIVPKAYMNFMWSFGHVVDYQIPRPYIFTRSM